MTEISEAIVRRIQGLAAKTVEHGATEEEAMLAAAKIRELMDRYRLSMSDVEIKAEAIVQETVDRSKVRQVAAVDYCMKGIERYCGVRMWYSARYNDDHKKIRKVRLLGLKADVEMARYLYAMIDATIHSELLVYCKTPEYKSRKGDRRATLAAATSFQVGMAARINERLTQMARDLEPVAKTATGTALVVVKGALVAEAFGKLGLKFKGPLGGMSVGASSAYGAGRAAGDRVNLSRPVGSAGTRQIGG